MAELKMVPLAATSPRKPGRSLSMDACAVMAAVGLALAVTLALLPVRTAGMATALVIYALVSVIAFANLQSHEHARFGLANIVTTMRAAVAAAIGGLMLSSDEFSSGNDTTALWGLGFITVLALALDGVDGYFARRWRTSSRFGARFDMEVDALLMFFLSIAAWQLGKAGIWVMAIGLMRYAFWAAQMLSPALRGELPAGLSASLRRKTICAVQGVVLCLLLLPPIAPPVSGWLAAAALALLAYSFTVDIIHLIRESCRQC